MATRTMSILHVSDVHNSLENIEALEKWLKSRRERVDVILLSGDVADMPMEYGFDTSKEAELFKTSYYEDYKVVVARLLAICSNVYSIPGNHDVPQLFQQQNGSSTDNITEDPFRNIHGRCLSIAPNLYVAGFGGSVPGYQDNQQIWKGFPFQSQEEMTKELDQFLPPLFAAETTPFKDPNDKLILMTHCGPNESSTTIAKPNPLNPIYSGSTGLDKWLASPEMQSRVFMNLHGHTHGSFGESQVGSISVLNCGSLLEKKFALYQLSRDTGSSAGQTSNDSYWKLSSVGRFNL